MNKDRKRLFFGDKDVMPITGFYGPFDRFHDSDPIFPDRIDDFRFKALAEAGVNHIMYCHTDYAEHPEAVMKSLDLCAKYGIRYMVLDSTITDYVEKPDQPSYTAEILEEQISKYANHPAFAGVFLVDEAWSEYYPVGIGFNSNKAISKYVDIADVLQKQLGYVAYHSLFPVWNVDYEGVKENYEKYLDEYFELMKPDVAIWGYYVFSSNRWDGLYGYFYNLNVVRERSIKAGIPFWACIQAGAQWNDEKKHFTSKPYFPNESQFDWNINTVLAFGVKGFSFFPLLQPEHFALAGTDEEPDWDFKRNGLMGATGEVNQWWYYAKRITEHIRAIDDVLMNSVHEGIIFTTEAARYDAREVTCRFDSGTYRELQSVDGDAMVGCFDYNGKMALYVVNYSTEEAQSITLNFDKEHPIKMVKEAVESHVIANVLKLDMAAGEGVLVVIE